MCSVHYDGPTLCECCGAVPEGKSLPLLRGLRSGRVNRIEIEETIGDIDYGSRTQKLEGCSSSQSVGSSSGLYLHASRDGELIY